MLNFSSLTLILVILGALLFATLSALGVPYFVILASVTALLVGIGIVAFIYGTIQISKYAFRIGTGRGIAALLFPPYTFYFAFFELDEEGKEAPAAAWAFGLLVSALLVAIFYNPLQLLVSGQIDKLEATSPGEAAAAEYASPEQGEEGSEEEPEPENVPPEEPEDEEGAADESGEESSEGGEEETAESEAGEDESGESDESGGEDDG